MAGDEVSEWGHQARRLARARLGSAEWVTDLTDKVNEAGDADFGTMIVAQAVLAKHADYYAEEVRLDEHWDAVTAYDNRPEVDTAIACAGGLVAFTVVVPWLIGRFGLRDTFLLPTRTSVPEPVRTVMRRALGHYFWADCLTGACVIGALVALLLLVRPWGNRKQGVIGGFVLLGCAVLLHILAVTLWNAQEAIVDEATVFPYPQSGDTVFGDAYGTCGVSNIVSLDGHRYYVWSSGQADKEGWTSYCDSIIAYEDWDRLAEADVSDVTAADAYGLHGTFNGSGRLCDTDGTPEGLIWSVLNGYGSGRYVISFIDAVAGAVLDNDEFAATYPMCETGG